MYGSGMGNGDKHDQNMVPIVLAGAAAGRLKGGRHIATPNQTPLANLIAGLGQVAGLELGQLAERHRSRGALGLVVAVPAKLAARPQRRAEERPAAEARRQARAHAQENSRGRVRADRERERPHRADRRDLRRRPRSPGEPSTTTSRASSSCSRFSPSSSVTT